mmetsp:Transcript_85271/g.151039  ORF Transcript_85271/g.151039 Transcript_85271/m.151039 type:complete len:250 (+) Transcript_85271:101-850(+)
MATAKAPVIKPAMNNQDELPSGGANFGDFMPMPTSSVCMPPHTIPPPSMCWVTMSCRESSGTASTLMWGLSSSSCLGFWFSGASRSMSTCTSMKLSFDKPGLKQRGPLTRIEDSCTTYPVSSFSSRAAACAGVSPGSISPATSSSVSQETGGRNCFTSSSFGAEVFERSIATRATASAENAGLSAEGNALVARMAASYFLVLPVRSRYVKLHNRRKRVECTTSQDSTEGASLPVASMLAKADSKGRLET